MGGRPAIGEIAVVPRELLASYHDYAGAQRAVDFLSDEHFPVEHTAIVGSDLKLVEQVTGRLTTGSAGVAGLASGAYFGLFIGLLFGIFTTGSVAGWFTVVAIAVAVGACWGGLFGLVAHALTGGRRDFSSRSTLTAQRYDVLVASEFAEQARQVLARLT